jgi:hypothetical protein
MIRTSAQRKKTLLARRRRVNAALKPATAVPAEQKPRDDSRPAETPLGHEQRAPS